MKLLRDRLNLLCFATLLCCCYANANPTCLEDDIKNLVSRLETKRNNVILEKYGVLKKTEINSIFDATPIKEALEEIETQVTEQTSQRINYHISDTIELSGKVNLHLRKTSADQAIRYIVSSTEGISCSFLRNDVYIHSALETLGPPEIQHLNEQLKHLNDTLGQLQTQIEALQMEQARRQTVEICEKYIFKDVSFRSEKLQDVTDFLNQKINENRNHSPSIHLVLLAPIEANPEVRFEAKNASFAQIVEDIANDLGWHIEYKRHSILLSPEKIAQREGLERINKLRETPLAPHISLGQTHRDEKRLTLRADHLKLNAESNTISCELVNNTNTPIYFVSNSVLAPEYVIADVDANGDRVDNLRLTCALGSALYTPELPPETLARFDVKIPPTQQRFQIGVKVGRKRYNVDHALESKDSQIRLHPLGTIWTETIERPQSNN